MPEYQPVVWLVLLRILLTVILVLNFIFFYLWFGFLMFQNFVILRKFDTGGGVSYGRRFFLYGGLLPSLSIPQSIPIFIMGAKIVYGG